MEAYDQSPSTTLPVHDHTCHGKTLMRLSTNSGCGSWYLYATQGIYHHMMMEVDNQPAPVVYDRYSEEHLDSRFV